jgi:RNA polymerase sigma-70 factor (ECF subfamily)
MASTIPNANISDFPAYFSQTATRNLDSYKQVYEQNRHRIYALAFWMTDNELLAEELLEKVFRGGFTDSLPSAETLDRLLVAELRDAIAVGAFTLRCSDAKEIVGARRNTRRVHLERAVVQLPATERLVFLMHDVEGYDHERIARTLGVTEEQTQHGLHQARLRMRELLAAMNNS